MPRNAFKGEEPEDEPPFEELMAAAEEIDEQWGELRARAAAGSKTAQHQLDLLMRDQEG